MSKFLSEVKGFTPVIDILANELGLMAAVVYGIVWRYCQMEDKVCTASRERIAEHANISSKTVERHLKELCKAGYLEDLTPEKRHRPHIYADSGKAKIKGLLMVEIGKTESPTPDRGKTESPTEPIQLDSKSNLSKTESLIRKPSYESHGGQERSSARSADKKPNARLPDTDFSRMMFGRLQANARTIGRRGPGRFQSLEQKRKFDDAAAKLGEAEFVRALQKGLEQGINAVDRLTNWIAKWNGDYKKGKPHATHRQIAPHAVAGSTYTPEEGARAAAILYGDAVPDL